MNLFSSPIHFISLFLDFQSYACSKCHVHYSWTSISKQPSTISKQPYRATPSKAMVLGTAYNCILYRINFLLSTRLEIIPITRHTVPSLKFRPLHMPVFYAFIIELKCNHIILQKFRVRSETPKTLYTLFASAIF